MECCQHRIDGATVWIGDNLIGGNYEGAVAVGTVQYEKGKTTYIFSEIDKAGSSVEIQGGPITETVPDKNLHMLEVQVYGMSPSLTVSVDHKIGAEIIHVFPFHNVINIYFQESTSTSFHV